MLFKKCFGSIILRFAQIYEGGIYYLALTYFLKNSNNFLTDTRKYYEKKVNLLSCKLQSSNSSCILHLQWKVSIYWKTWRLDLAAKGQIKPKADCRAVDSPETRTPFKWVTKQKYIINKMVIIENPLTCSNFVIFWDRKK